MILLLQIKCSKETDHENSFHRMLFVFLCKNAACSKINDASNFSVFRSLLPRNNPFYNSISPLDPSIEVPDPYFNPKTYAKLCVICGCRADKKCATCKKRWYCSRQHQILDWKTHKEQCNPLLPNNEIDEGNQPALDCARSLCDFLFKEFKIRMESEIYETDSDSDLETNSNEDGEVNDMKKDSAKLQMLVLADEEFDCNFEENSSDAKFSHFQRTISGNPRQILRYDRGGEPLFATDYSEVPKTIPQCSICGAERYFELQLMPELINAINLDSVDHSIDWATVIIYTCSRNCSIEGGKYAREYAFKQDFNVSPVVNRIKGM